MRRFFVFLGMVLLWTVPAKAQWDNRVFLNEPAFPDTVAGNLFLGVDHLFYFRNNEYFNPFADGYTLTGHHLFPSLIYLPGKDVSLHAGFFMNQEFGKSGNPGIYPVVGVRFKKWGLETLLGRINGNHFHRLPQPVYSFERSLTDPLEFGMQSIVSKENLFIDTWIHWEQMIERYDDEQEKIWGGFHGIWSPVNTGRTRLHVSMLVTAFHYGGQIDISGLPVYTLWNAAAGAGYTLMSRHSERITSAGLETQLHLSHQASEGGINPFGKGWGLYMEAFVNTVVVDGALSYWKGDSYYAEFGDPLFSSVSRKVNREGYTEKKRDLFVLRLKKDIRIMDGFWLSIRFEPFWDSRYGVDFSHGVYLHYTGCFSLLRKKL
ncbi:MAG TPA: hypothetical protein ENN63_13260 [Bacteroidetes bacterium]|nr:hypothetical protein [Bacteroidota bacterium]